jgi:hypothetical protein
MGKLDGKKVAILVTDGFEQVGNDEAARSAGGSGRGNKDRFA